jgi:hypothetical protein
MAKAPELLDDVGHANVLPQITRTARIKEEEEGKRTSAEYLS